MNKLVLKQLVCTVVIGCSLWSCKAPQVAQNPENRSEMPENFGLYTDTVNSGITPWRQFFTDPELVSLIDTALQNNQELMITLQEIEIAKSGVLAKKGKLTPTVSAGIGAGLKKAGRYTSEGAGDATTEIELSLIHI